MSFKRKNLQEIGRQTIDYSDKNVAEVDIAPASGKIIKNMKYDQGHQVRLSLMQRKANFDIKIIKVNEP